MLIKTDAIALRVDPFSRTSHVVNWLAPAHGRMATVIKGGQRPRSHLGGQYDLFYRCEIVFYARSRNGLHVLKECAVLNDRPAIRSSWRATVCASYCCDLTARCCPPGISQPAVFELLDEALNALDERAARAAFLYWFELQLLGRLGWALRLTRCARCGRSASSHRHAAAMSARDGGLICLACSEAPGLESMTIGADVLAAMRKWQSDRPAESAGRVVLTPRQTQAAQDILGRFLAHHLFDLPPSRGMALSLIQDAGPRGRLTH